MKPFNVMRLRQGFTVPSGDPYWVYVVSLMHFDGPNGSTTMVDSAGTDWTPTGVSISTAQFKFGGSSLALGGGRITKNGGAAFSFGTGDFTLEMWLIRTTFGVVFDDRVGSLGAGMALYVPNNTTNLVFFANGSDRITFPAYPSGVFKHVAISRSSGTTRMFVDGVLAGSYVDNNSYLANTWVVGSAFNNTVNFGGFVDDFRATKGVARYTSAFTPPSAPFPNS